MVKIEQPLYSFEYILNGMEYLRLIENCGRTSYRSKSKLVDEYNKLFRTVPDSLHESLEISNAKWVFWEKINDIINKIYNIHGRNYEQDVFSKYTHLTSLIDRDLERVKDASALQFVKEIIQLGHLSVLEFSFLVIRFHVNIGYTREQNRHRMTSIIEQSTRYCNFSQDRFENQIHCIKPIWFDPSITNTYSDVIKDEMDIWKTNMEQSEANYLNTINRLTEKAKLTIQDPKKYAEYVKQIPQMARGCLPLDTSSEECIGANLREWADVILFERANPNAHPSMQQIMYQLKMDLQQRIPVIFDYTKKIVREF